MALINADKIVEISKEIYMFKYNNRINNIII